MLLLIAGIGQLIGCIFNLVAIAWFANRDNDDNDAWDGDVNNNVNVPPATFDFADPPPAPPLVSSLYRLSPGSLTSTRTTTTTTSSLTNVPHAASPPTLQPLPPPTHP